MYKLNWLNLPNSLILLVCSFFLMEIASAQTLSVQSPDDSLTVGQKFELSFTINSKENYNKVIFPDSTQFPSQLTFHKVEHYKVSDFSDSTKYQLQFFATSDVNLPPLPVKVLSNTDTVTLFSPPITLIYKQTISSTADEFKPYKPVYEFPKSIWPYFVILLFLAIIGYLLWKKYANREIVEVEEPKAKPVFTNPLDELERSLSRIRNNHQNLPIKNYKHFYSELGDALRLYFEELYNIPALESTTREVMRYLDAFGVDTELTQRTRNVLNEADMIKFAKFTPTLDQSWKALDEADAFLLRAKNVDMMRIDRKRKEFDLLHTVNEDADGIR